MIKVGCSKIHGRGVFATKAIREGTMFETSHLLPFGCGEGKLISSTRAGAYAFYIRDCTTHPDEELIGIALSPMSFVNHSRDPNVEFVVDPQALVIRFKAVKPVSRGDELTIDYGEFADTLGLD